MATDEDQTEANEGPQGVSQPMPEEIKPQPVVEVDLKMLHEGMIEMFQKINSVDNGHQMTVKLMISLAKEMGFSLKQEDLGEGRARYTWVKKMIIPGNQIPFNPRN